MKILILNGSPRVKGNTAAMVAAFEKGAQEAGHEVLVVPVPKKKIAGCLACEYCHTKEREVCVQKDDMIEVYSALNQSVMLVLASPIYYHGISGQLKCTIDRLYAVAYPKKPPYLKKIALFLSSGDNYQYDGALFSYQGDFLDYLGLEDMGVFTATGVTHNGKSVLDDIYELGRSLTK